MVVFSFQLSVGSCFQLIFFKMVLVTLGCFDNKGDLQRSIFVVFKSLDQCVGAKIYTIFSVYLNCISFYIFNLLNL